MPHTIEDAQDVILGKINQICGKFGLNNVMAQLYALLYLSGKPLSLDDMVNRLKISKGSASVNMRALERYGTVRRIWVKGSRKDYYEAEPDIAKVIRERIKSMVEGRLSEIDEMLNSSSETLASVNYCGKEDPEAVKLFEERLEKVRDLYKQAKSMFDLFKLYPIELTDFSKNKNIDKQTDHTTSGVAVTK